ncbi:DNA polymerase 1 [Striga asiatica]|uniref:DNA polymerase 1 n=1 Tax=Striga asiatica TaxID=4170 RepID=A0A5A7QS88_STRAF|nr:DNA polymerase 1 [Striga asiatica]
MTKLKDKHKQLYDKEDLFCLLKFLRNTRFHPLYVSKNTLGAIVEGGAGEKMMHFEKYISSRLPGLLVELYEAIFKANSLASDEDRALFNTTFGKNLYERQNQ